MKILKKILKAFLIVILLLLLGFIGLIVYAVLTDYKPKEKEVVFNSETRDKLNDTIELSLLTWNIGYCGLDKDMDFFYDGGTKVFTPRKKCISNL